MTREQRAEHCRRIAAHGGTVTAQRYGRFHMSAIGKAGAQVTIARHGVGYWQGLVKAKGWHGARHDALLTDLACGKTMMELGAGR